MDLVSSNVSYVVQETTIVVKDILRKYPNKYVRLVIVGTLTNLIGACSHNTLRSSGHLERS